MAFRMNGGGNRRNDNNRNFDRGYGNNSNRQINPWVSISLAHMNMCKKKTTTIQNIDTICFVSAPDDKRINRFFFNIITINQNQIQDNSSGSGNFRQSGGGNVNNDVISLANSLVNNLLRGNQPPSLLDLPQRGTGYGNQMNFGRFDDRKVSAY